MARAEKATPTEVSVDCFSEFSRQASAGWHMDGARFHVWFDVDTREIVGPLYKNPLVDEKHPEHFNTRKLDTRVPKNAEIIRVVFEEIDRKDLIGAAKRAEEDKERKRQAETAAWQREEKIKGAAMRLLALVKRWRDNEGQDGCCLPVIKVCHCKKCETKALLSELGEAS